jgi:hypothetical protein
LFFVPASGRGNAIWLCFVVVLALKELHDRVGANEPFEISKYQQAKVHPNCHVVLSEDKHHYSVPYPYVGKKIDIKYYYPIEHQKTLLKSIEDYPSQIVLISRGDDTFMNGKFVKSWIGQNVGKVIVLVIIDYKFSNQKLRNILINNEFSEHNLQYFGLLFDYGRISDVTIYVKNVQNANYVDITDEEDLTITDDDKYAYTERGNINSCRSIITRGSPNSNIASAPNSNIYARNPKKNRDNCKVKCSIMG